MRKFFVRLLLRAILCLAATCFIYWIVTGIFPVQADTVNHKLFLLMYVGSCVFVLMPQPMAYKPKRLQGRYVRKNTEAAVVQQKKREVYDQDKENYPSQTGEIVSESTERPHNKAGEKKQSKKEKENDSLSFSSSLEGICPVRSDVLFSDIAGYEGTKSAVRFLVSCLRNNKDIAEIGAKMPKGMLLSGPPGTGKTFLAKAIAGEAGVPFFAVDGSSFQDLYVGQGPRNVRALYKAAMEHAPCVVFIDEIDAIGGRRNSGDTNSERRNTLNALLVALDGLKGTSGILTIAATNTAEELDPALVRPGRFDRKVYMPLPDARERELILKIHCRNKKVSEEVDYRQMALATSGFSGAALATMANEAALNAVYNCRQIVIKKDFDTAYFQIMTNGEQKRAASEEERRLVAYHEIGHALIMKLVANQDVPFVTNIGSTNGIGGFTTNIEKPNGLPTKIDMENQIMICYGGRAAEELYCGKENITVGASADIRAATQNIRAYLGAYGMGNSGMLNVSELLGRPDDEMLDEAKELSTKLYEKTLQVLKEHRKELDAVAEALVNKEVLTDTDINQIIASCK